MRKTGLCIRSFIHCLLLFNLLLNQHILVNTAQLPQLVLLQIRQGFSYCKDIVVGSERLYIAIGTGTIDRVAFGVLAYDEAELHTGTDRIGIYRHKYTSFLFRFIEPKRPWSLACSNSTT